MNSAKKETYRRFQVLGYNYSILMCAKRLKVCLSLYVGTQIYLQSQSQSQIQMLKCTEVYTGSKTQVQFAHV